MFVENMIEIIIIVTSLITLICMVLNVEHIPPTIMDVVLSDYTIATTMKCDLQVHILTIFLLIEYL